MDEMILVLTNAPDEASALAIAETLVEAKAAACVSCLPAVQSVYRWQGQLEHATEVSVQIKTSRANYEKVESLIVANHPYEVPEIIAVPIIAGLPAYLRWLKDETQSIST